MGWEGSGIWTVSSGNLFEVQRAEMYRMHRLFTEGRLIHPGIVSQAVEKVFIQAGDLYKGSLGAQVGKDSANGMMTSACLHCRPKCLRSSLTVNDGSWLHLNERVSDLEGNKPSTLANVFILGVEKN